MAVVNNNGVIEVDVSGVTNNAGVIEVTGVASADVFFGVARIVTATPADRPVLTAEGSNTRDFQIILSWTAPPEAGITGYVLQRKVKTGETWSTIYSGPNLTFSSNDGEQGVEYSFRVRADKGALPGAWSAEIDWTPILLVPGIIEMLTITETPGMGQFKADWSASARATGYEYQWTSLGATSTGTTTATTRTVRWEGRRPPTEGGPDAPPDPLPRSRSTRIRVRGTRTGGGVGAWTAAFINSGVSGGGSCEDGQCGRSCGGSGGGGPGPGGGPGEDCSCSNSGQCGLGSCECAQDPGDSSPISCHGE